MGLTRAGWWFHGSQVRCWHPSTWAIPGPLGTLGLGPFSRAHALPRCRSSFFFRPLQRMSQQVRRNIPRRTSTVWPLRILWFCRLRPRPPDPWSTWPRSIFKRTWWRQQRAGIPPKWHSCSYVRPGVATLCTRGSPCQNIPPTTSRPFGFDGGMVRYVEGHLTLAAGRVSLLGGGVGPICGAARFGSSAVRQFGAGGGRPSEFRSLEHHELTMTSPWTSWTHHEYLII